MPHTESVQARAFRVPRFKALLCPIAAGLVLSGLASAQAAPASSASRPAGAAAKSTRDSRALLNQRLRKCKVMSGDEKAACEKDAHSAAAGKAHKERGAARP